MMYFTYSHLTDGCAAVTPRGISPDGHTRVLALTTHKAASAATPHGLPYPTEGAPKLQYGKC